MIVESVPITCLKGGRICRSSLWIQLDNLVLQMLKQGEESYYE